MASASTPTLSTTGRSNPLPSAVSVTVWPSSLATTRNKHREKVIERMEGGVREEDWGEEEVEERRRQRPELGKGDE